MGLPTGKDAIPGLPPCMLHLVETLKRDPLNGHKDILKEFAITEILLRVIQYPLFSQHQVTHELHSPLNFPNAPAPCSDMHIADI
jgi:hypothetical protein